MSDYYIDFDSGSDLNSGTSIGAPFKHCPGDNNATGTAAATTLVAGDNVYFRGGVTYRGRVNMDWSGGSSNLISYIGDEWGAEKAIVSAADPVSITWTKASSSADVKDNANWGNMWYATLPSEIVSPFQYVFYNNAADYLKISQSNSPTYRAILDYLSDWPEVPYTDVTPTTLTDTTFNSSDPDFFNDAWIGLWVQGNRVTWEQITSFDPATDTITFTTADSPPYVDGTTPYTVVGLAQYVSGAGEFGVSITDSVIYMYPPDGYSPNSMDFEVSTRGHCFYGASVGNITIKGFRFYGAFAGYNAGSINGGATAVSGTATGDIIVRDCTYFACRTLDKNYMIRVPGGLDSVVIENNDMSEIYGGGLVVGGNAQVAWNTFNMMARTVIYVAGGNSSTIINNNVISDVWGVHANGISVYQGSDGVYVTNNRISRAPSLLTYKDSSNLSFHGNVIDAGGWDYRINDWGNCSGLISWINNTLVNNSNSTILLISSTEPTMTYEMRNNIIDGGGPSQSPGFNVIRTNNTYTGLAFYQEPKDGWLLGAGSFESSNADLFVKPSASNYALKIGSPAIESGYDVSATGYTEDIDGTAVPLGSSYNIGAYGRLGDPTPPSNMTNPDLTTTQPQAALDIIKADCDTLNALGVGTSIITASDLTNALNTTAGEIAVQKTNQDNLNVDNALGLTLTVPSGDFVNQFQTLYDNNVAIEAVI